MNSLTKIIWAFSIFIWLIVLIVLTIALTDLIPDNPFREYGFIIGIGFISLSGFMRNAYKKRGNKWII